MSVLKNNGINLGNGDPSSIANGDLKRVGSDLFIRSGGAWVGVGGGGGTYASGEIDGRSPWNINTGLTGSTTYILAARGHVQIYTEAGTTLNSGGTGHDSAQLMGWIGVGL